MAKSITLDELLGVNEVAELKGVDSGKYILKKHYVRPETTIERICAKVC